MPATVVIAFLVLSGFIVYTIAGYPVLLAWMARRRSKPVIKRFEPRTVSFVISVYNGEHFLGDKLRSILDLDYPRDRMEVLVVSDGSTDGTDRIAASFAPEGVKFLRVPRCGKPAALNVAVAQTSGEILVLTDVRQTLERSSLLRMVACFADPSVGVVSGDLVIREGNTEETNVGLYWRYERWIRKMLGRVDSMLGATGPFYAIRRDLFRPMPKDLLLDDMYIPLGAFFRGYRLIVEEDAKAFDYPTPVDVEFRRKVRTLAGNYELLRYYPELLSLRNRMLFHYLSYKIARLALPWIVLMIFVVSFGLPAPWRNIAVLGQVLFYLVAATDLLVGPDSRWKRISSPPRTVVSMLAASACAPFMFLMDAERRWKPTQIPVTRKGP